ncbi:MFS transporter [Fusibacter paucivorans]|uniref:MFS transporter n=1 Tax=Fusibacter paucivorans TaxID=76009 RepID=A0ABS5PU55_9FIRM|nr:MFS transporter [Fusibacter paucivorans]MBS7527929.1 MFS transporter [Fusibacter paucivorans]
MENTNFSSEQNESYLVKNQGKILNENTGKLKTAPKYRFVVFSLMVLPYLLVYGGLQITSSLGPDIMHTFGFEEGGLSLFSSLGTMTKAILSAIAGGLMVKYGGKRIVLVGLAVSAISGLLYILAPTNFTMLSFVRILQGAGGGMIAACLMSLICVWFPKKERGTAQSALTCFFGLSVSAVTFYIYLCGNAGIVWNRMIGIWLLVGGGVMLVLIAFLYKDIEKKYGVASIDDALEPQDNEVEAVRAIPIQSFKAPEWANVMKFPGFWLTIIMIFFSGACLYGVGFVMPLFLQSIGFDTAGITSVMSLGPLSSIIFALLGGTISDRVFHSKRTEVAMISYFGCAALFMVMFFSGHATSVTMMTVLFFLAYGTLYFSSGPLWCIPAEVVRLKDASKNMGICVMVSGFGGFAMMLVFGILIQYTSAAIGGFFLAFCMVMVAVCAVILKRAYSI